jgi:hypothetical protein
MSLRICEVQRRKLPDTHSCGARCGEFPACLPLLPAATPMALATLLTKSQLDRQHARFLEELGHAITDMEDGA